MKAVIFACILCFSLTGLEMQSQVYLISSGDFSACSGDLLSSGGENNSYSPNENFSCTLSGVGTSNVGVRMVINSIQAGDTLRIYDGTDLLSPLLAEISGGNYLGYSFVANNANHALTFHFQSNADDLVGNFKFSIACNNCQGVRPVINGGEPRIDACVGDTIALTGSNSMLGVGGVSQAFWTTDDGTIFSNAWPQASRAYNAPGMYYVGMNFENTMGCSGVFPAYVQIRVANPPQVHLSISDSSVCIGQPVIMSLQADTSAWAPAILGVGGQIPDVSTFSSSITLTGNGSVQSESDLVQVTCTLEHSYMSDLSITLICPNGQEMILKNSGVGGGNWLGIPIDNTNATPGVGASYTWSPTVVSPVMGDANCVYQTVNGGGQSLVPGEYAAASSWSTLIGCPVSGTWTLFFQDVAGADDGWVTDWSIAVNGMTSGDLYEPFQSVVTASCSGISWEGPFNFINTNNCRNSLIYPYGGGAFLIEATATNTFGCASSDARLIEVSASFDAVVNVTGPTTQQLGSASILFTAGEGDHFIAWSTGEQGVTSIDHLSPGNYSVLIADSAGCSTTIPFIIQSPLAVDFNRSDEFVCLYKTTNKELFYSIPTASNMPWTFNIYDGQGKLVHTFKKQAPASGTESLALLSPGVYIVECLNQTERKTMRFVVSE